jgi:hypothetical protein
MGIGARNRKKIGIRVSARGLVLIGTSWRVVSESGRRVTPIEEIFRPGSHGVHGTWRCQNYCLSSDVHLMKCQNGIELVQRHISGDGTVRSEKLQEKVS